MTTVGKADVTLVKENEDGSAVYQFKFPTEVMEALTRLGILTAIQAGLDNAEKLHPDKREWVGLTDEEKRFFSSWLDDKADNEVFEDIEAKLKEKNT